MLGDVMLGRLIDAAVLPHPVSEEWEGGRSMTALGQPYRSKYLPRHPSEETYFSRLWGDTAELLTKSACNLINLECCITESENKFPKTFNFRTNPANIGALLFVPVHFACLANNHVLDYEAPGLKDTVDVLKAAGIQYAGAGQDLSEASKAAEVKVPFMSHRMHVLSFADHGSGIVRDGKDVWAATNTRPGIWYVNVENLTDQDRENLARRVRESAAHAESTLSVVSAHVGPNWSWAVRPAIRRLARTLVQEGGVSIFHGHSSHHVQGVEFIDGKPIVYGAGPFLDDYATDVDFRNDLGFIYQYELPLVAEASTTMHCTPVVWAHPIRIKEFRVQRIKDADDPDFKWLATTMARLCQNLGSKAEAESSSPPTIRISPF
jgi:poly-gamma-glutamate capsule biosynthesis protein CapA/YwtB (metallophosphatase superfamily)